ncbi:MAG: hypothetical protein P4M11_01200 [Candidatus Pacebacteria bacterium]|nr:hypothetical protein [Candidatus Paceibacterota bacterium]
MSHHCVSKYLQWMNEDYILFERFIKTSRPNGMHMNLQLVGVPQKFSTSMRDHFEKFARKRKVSIQDITSSVPGLPALKSHITDKEAEYLYIEFFDLKTAKGRNRCRMLYVAGKEARGLSPQLGREFVCGLLELFDRVDWRKCKMGNEDEEKLALALKSNMLGSGVEL